MAWDRVDRRRSGEVRLPLPEEYQGPERGGPGRPQGGDNPLLDPETGFFTMPTLAELIQYEIDGSAQTLRNELHVTPLCLVAIAVDRPPGATDGEPGKRFTGAVHEGVRRATRTADRVALGTDRLIVLTRRTMANSLRDFYAPRLTEIMAEACAEWGTITVWLGISSLVEHLARSPDHLVRMAYRALEESRRLQQVVTVYDFRKMSLE